MPELQELGQDPAAIRDKEEEDDDDDDIDETLMERLYGLREMFPEFLRNGRTGLWVAASSATILALPVLLEKEMIDLSDMEAAQQREMFLGPGMGAPGAGAMGMGGVPQPQLTPVAATGIPQPGS